MTAEGVDHGIIANGYRISSQQYADDILILGNTNTIQRQLRMLVVFSNEATLQLSWNKCEALWFGQRTDTRPEYKEIDAERKTPFKDEILWLGRAVGGHGSLQTDVQCRTVKAHQAFAKLRKVLTNGRNPTEVEIEDGIELH